MRGARIRRRLGPEEWSVRARVERFGEPALLLLLRESPRHGYELLDLLPALTGEERVDMGNLYRVLRALEEEGVVASEWRDDLPGQVKRIYELTPIGEKLLDTWADALRESRTHVAAFLDRYDGKEVNDAPRT